MIEAYFDGCCEPINPGGTASYGAAILVDGAPIWEHGAIVPAPPGGQTSNNVAEYSGFIAVANYLLDNPMPQHAVVIRGDSMLVVKQVQGQWRVHRGHYVSFYNTAHLLWKRLKKRYKTITLVWIPREQNGLADQLSKCLLVKAGVEFRLQPL